MDGPPSNLNRLNARTASSTLAAAAIDRPTPPPQPVTSTSTPDPAILANQELIRPPGYRRPGAGLAAFSAAWYEELEQKRYQRHGVWLPSALEFGRHPGESLLLLGAGLGSDVVQYVTTGTPVTVGITARDYPDQLRENLMRRGLAVPVVDVSKPVLPFPDGTFDVVTWNALYDPELPDPARINELFRVLKPGGKVIALFPAWYDAGFWQDVLLPLQWLYWRRPPDPTTGLKTTSRQLHRLFGGFTQHRVAKRHLRRSELPHLWRALPLVVLERFIGRILVYRGIKPLPALGANSKLEARNSK